MFKRNDQDRQIGMFNSIYNLPSKQLNQLEDSWAGTFYREYFCRIDETPFAKVFSDEPSRPNYPVNVFVGLDTLKAGLGWSDEELYENFCFNLQVRYAVGCCDMDKGYFELRTLYYHRQRVSQHMQKTGENLYEQAFEQVADEQTKVFQLKTGKLRMDSTQIASNIREMSRLQLLVEVLQRVHRILSEEDQNHYSEDFDPYLRGSSGQYVYRIKGQDVANHLGSIGKLMYRLVEELRENYEQEPTYQMLVRVLHEHFASDDENNLRPRKGEELSAGSLQSPDDWEATYRRKDDEGHRGYVANLTETCDPENKFQLINKVQVEPNNTEDADMLLEALPDLKECTDVEEMHTDGGYGSPDVDEAMRKAKVEQIQTAIRGRKSAEEKLGLEDFDWEIDENGKPQKVICPHVQRVEVQPGREKNRYLAYFDSTVCRDCPWVDQCPTEPHKRKPRQALRFSQQETDLALRRKRSADMRISGKNLRAGAESMMRSVKHRYRNGKLPIRGKLRVAMMVIASAAMTNIRRIHGYEEKLREEKRKAKVLLSQMEEAIKDIFVLFLGFLHRCLMKRPHSKTAVWLVQN